MAICGRWARRLASMSVLPLLLSAPLTPALADRVLPKPRLPGSARYLQSPDLETGVLAELNRLRADPDGYSRKLEQFRQYYRDNIVRIPGTATNYETEEGTAPLDEAVEYLRHQAAQREYLASDRLAQAASDHVLEQAADGAVGHVGTDGSTPGERVTRRGGGRYVAEVITYGSGTPADVVRQLIIDDGVRDRGHRLILFAQDFRYAGVICGPHPVYRTMCVVDLARTPDGQARNFDGEQLAMR